jgi:AraC-like DNA-binding protein
VPEESPPMPLFVLRGAQSFADQLDLNLYRHYAVLAPFYDDGPMQAPSTAVKEFVDPDDYLGSFSSAAAELSVMRQGSFQARVIRLDFGRLRMHRFDESLPRVGHWANSDPRAVVTFRTEPGPSLFFCGTEMLATRITRHVERETGFLSSTGPASWASMSMSVEDLVAAGEAAGTCDLSPPTQDWSLTPTLPAMARLQRLHLQAARLALRQPATVANSGAAHGLEQALTEALMDCFAGVEIREERGPRHQHSKILRRFRTFVERKSFEPIFLPELCAAIGVAPRTLRAICQEQLGTSPKRYLLHRRMLLARRALRAADPAVATVTEIATGFGFWELGRFAVAYRRMFSETPSATLKAESRPLPACHLF